MKLILPLLLAFCILFFGIIVNGHLALYQQFQHLDSVMHFLGGIAIGWFILAYAAQRGKTLPHRNKVIWLALLIGLAWEIAEQTSGLFFKGTEFYRFFHGGGPIDTVFDLLFDMAGAMLAYVLYPKKLHAFERSDSQKA
jgi:hypothetical protein